MWNEFVISNEYPLKYKWYKYPVERMLTLQSLGILFTRYFPKLKHGNYDRIEKLERGCVDAAIYHPDATNINWNNDRFVNIYNVKAMTLLRNMNPTCTTGQSKVIAGLLATPGYPYEKIPLMHPSEWQPELNASITKIIQESDNLKNQLGGAGWSSTQQHECTKCGKTKCLYRAVQIRSGDEDASIFYHCQECNHVDFEF